MSSFKLNRLQRVGLLITATLIAWFLWEQIAENGLSETSWLSPILAIAGILLLATHGIAQEKLTTVVDLSATDVGHEKSRFRIAPINWRLGLLFAVVTIAVVSIIALSLSRVRATDEVDAVTRMDDVEGRIRARANARSTAPTDEQIDELFHRREQSGKPRTFFSKRFEQVSIQLPSGWHWLNRDDATALDESAEAFTSSIGFDAKSEPNNVLAAGKAVDDTGRSIATVRLSLRPGKAASQIEMRQALREPQASIRREIVAEAEKTASAMRRLPTTSYYRVTGGAFRQNASVACLWTAFEYDVGRGPTVSDTWVCPLGDRTLKLSTSYAKVNAAQFANTIEHIWRSLDAR